MADSHKLVFVTDNAHVVCFQLQTEDGKKGPVISFFQLPELFKDCSLSAVYGVSYFFMVSYAQFFNYS